MEDGVLLADSALERLALKGKGYSGEATVNLLSPHHAVPSEQDER